MKISSYLSALAQLNLNDLRIERKNNAIVRSTETIETQIQEAKLRNEKLKKFVIFLIYFTISNYN